MIIKPYQTYDSVVAMLESIGLTDVVETWSGTSGRKLNFKFPDGTEVTEAVVSIGQYSSAQAKLMYDLNAHMVLAYSAASTPVADVSLASGVTNTVLMLVVPSETGTIKADAINGLWGNIFNVCADVIADTQSETSAILLPAYVKTYRNNTYVAIDLKNCYVSLNTVYPPCQKFVDETGTKWIALGGPLLYKVPTTD